MSYLNTVPLVWGMLHGRQRGLFDLSFSIPSECADRLATGRADIGIVPCVEAARQKLVTIPGVGIACRGPVRSILLISKVPFPRIRTLAADSSSRTSVMLARIVLSKRYGAQPDVQPHRPDLLSMLDEADACLIIGDPALLVDPHDLPFFVLDLGTEWMELTELPMVFAIWAARPDVFGQNPQPFMDSLRYGMDHLDEIVAQEAPKRGISRELAHEYLTRYIVFDIGPKEREGLNLFLQYTEELQSELDLRRAAV